MYKLKILFLARKNDKYSKQCEKYLKGKFKKVIRIDEKINSKIFNKKLNFNPDLILLFRHKSILKNDLIQKAKIACINFHPSPPSYRGMGGVNYAIYNEDKYFGCTCHLIENQKIDSGKIIHVKKFLVKKKPDLTYLLKKTHMNLQKQMLYVIPHIVSKNKINHMIQKFKHVKWSKKYYNKDHLDNFYIIKPNEKELDKKIRATYLNKYFKPIFFKKN